MSKKGKIILIISAIIIAIIAIFVGVYFYLLSSVSSGSTKVSFTVNQGDSKMEIVTNLKDAGLIRNKYAALIYIVLSGNTNIQAGSYELNRNMSTEDIIKSLANGDIINTERESVSLTFREGITLEEYLELLSENTNLEYDTMITEINDPEFLNDLINDYWFLTDDILNNDLYYGLEGYLYPNTYQVHTETTLGEVVRKMLDETEKKLEALRSEIEASNYSVHEILTMASITEKEAVNYEDRTKVAQVIYTRLNLGMNLGMDVTTYYGVGKSMTETLTALDLADDNPYNTRNASLIGLPVGPICMPSIESIEAVLNPADTNYIYFFADIVTGNVYFTDDYNEFLEFQRLYG